MKKKSPFKIFAHRGAPQLAPENTIPALEAAIANGASWVECDLQLTKDNQVVIFHDETLERTTNGFGNLADLNFDAVAQLDAGSWFDKQFSGTRVPTLEDWLVCAAQFNLNLNLELKIQTKAQATLMAQLLKQHLKNYWPLSFNKLLISSTDLTVLADVAKASENTLRLALIADHLFSESEMQMLSERQFYSLHHHYPSITPAYVSKAHAYGFKVYVYTVNNIDEFNHLKNDCHVDGLFTDVIPFPKEFVL